MADCLLVPIHVEALFSAQTRAVSEALEDFSRLPYCYRSQRDINPDTGYISEEIVSQPFQNQNLYLKAGVHLHWFLPPALTKGEVGPDGSTFPRVPDRWLITRLEESVVKQQWVVESDYLHPEGEGEDCVAYPLRPEELKKLDGDEFCAPYRRLGRALTLKDWLDAGSNSSNKYLNQVSRIGLTALGYGLPTFAGFYPNCHSVFGFYEEIGGPLPTDLKLKYSVVGWYSDLDDDFLKKSLAREAEKKEPRAVLVMLRDDFNWISQDSSLGPDVQRMFCGGVVSIQVPDPGTQNSTFSAQKIAIANSGAEALSAYLAEALAGENKELIEEQLELLSIDPALLRVIPEQDAIRESRRHERAFNAVYGGSQWTIEPDASSRAASRSFQEKVGQLPDTFVQPLRELNLLQGRYDRAMQEITTLRQQLFSDWYKYVLCAYPPEGSSDDYPDIDEVMHFIQKRYIDEAGNPESLSALVKKNGSLTLERDDNVQDHPIRRAIGTPGTLAADLAKKINDLLALVDPQTNHYHLTVIPAARYWQPKEPVVLVEHEAAMLSGGEDDPRLPCVVVDDPGGHDRAGSDGTQKKTPAEIIVEKVNALPVSETKHPIPIFLEWEVEFFPLSEGSNVFPARDYRKEFITANFALNEGAVELGKLPGKKTVYSAQIYSGSSTLTSYAGGQLEQRITDFLFSDLKNSKMGSGGAGSRAWYQIGTAYESDPPQSESFRKWLCANIESLCQRSKLDPADPITIFLHAFRALQGKAFLSQALSGFNDALLMHKQTLQLPIADPLGFGEYQAFAAQVNSLIAGENKSAPQPLDEFNPIRAGAMKILHLRLVDTFGRIQELPCDNVVASRQLGGTVDAQKRIALPPRLVQPARLSFRWRPADRIPGGKSTVGPAAGNVRPGEGQTYVTHPICGWLLPNFLDQSVMVYDQAGCGLGSASKRGWQPAPGGTTTAVTGIPNQSLRTVAAYIQNNFQGFLEYLVGALENIAPDHPDGPVELALLMGHPLAVVCASLELELLGRPVIHQGWNVFRQDLGRKTRDSDAFESVLFPVRLGEAEQWNDGLVGYWPEDGSVFHTPQNILALAANEPARRLIMLMDPHGKVHATTGVLPVKAIDIPPEQYSDLLHNLAVTFLAAPVLTGLNQVSLPVPAEAGYAWTWLDEKNGIWKEVGLPASQEAFAAPQEIREVWLKLTPGEDQTNKNPGQGGKNGR